MTSQIKRPRIKPPKMWPVQDAKARFSEFLEASVREGPQIVTKRGVETAVLVPMEQWQRINETSGRSIIDILVNDPRRFELDLPDRRKVFGRREPVGLD